MNRTRYLLAPLTIALLAALPATASAGSIRLQPPKSVSVRQVGLAATSNGRASILVPVRYPIEFSGRLAEVRVRLTDPGSGFVRTLVTHEVVSSGPRHRPEKRRGFTFVHRIGLDSALSARLRDGLQVRVLAPGGADVNGDGKKELHSVSELEQRLGPAPRLICSDVPKLKLRPGRRVSVPLPVCGSAVRWRLAGSPEHGSARIRHGRLVYSAPRRFRGSDPLRLVGRPLGGGGARSSAEAPLASDVEVTVGTATGAVVRALGDSVTAGFGYYSNGTPMTIGHLLECRPAEKVFNDACSSNSLNTSSKNPEVVYAPDYGLSNNISWAAQWANEHGITNFENLAVSGSEPSDWAPGGEFHKTTQQVEAEDPDYLLMTIGANPLLDQMLFGLDNMGCAIYSDIFGGYSECIRRAFAGVHLRENLEALYTDLVQHTDATIYLMRYHLSVPSIALAYSATQIAEMVELMNSEIAAVAAEVNPQRLQVVTPPHFDVGIDISPVYPSTFSCSRLGYKVDGPSVQSAPTQKELAILHPLSFCKGPASGGPPWVISGDTGVHPSAAGYQQMASQVPAPAG
ncbi:MAG: SGNH/GDSL hydrolase family protein [Solirubrobacterales bacterium]